MVSTLLVVGVIVVVIGVAYLILTRPGPDDYLLVKENGEWVLKHQNPKYAITKSEYPRDEALEVRQQTTLPARPSKSQGIVGAIASRPLPSPVNNHQTDEALQSLVDYYSPRRGRFTSWWQQGRAEARNKLLTVLSEEQSLVIKRGAELEELVRQRQKTELEFQKFLAQHIITLQELKLREVLIENALRAGLPVEDHTRLVVAERESQARTDEEKRRSDIKVSEHERLTEINLQSRWLEITQDLDAADLVQMSEQQLLRKLTDNLTALYREQHQIEIGDDPPQVKERILARYEKNIEHLESLIDAKQAGHFSSQDREEAGRFAAGEADG